MNQLETNMLIKDCIAGDDRAIAKFIDIFRPDVFRMALSILDDPAEADEAAQDALLRALKNLSSYRGESKLINWLYSITLNVCIGRLRKRRTRDRLIHTLSQVLIIGDAENHHREEKAIQNETNADVWRAIQSLPEKHRITITLRYYHTLPISEIAEILQVSERTVHNRLHEAHERLRLNLGERLARQ